MDARLRWAGVHKKSTTQRKFGVYYVEPLPTILNLRRIVDDD